MGSEHDVWRHELQERPLQRVREIDRDTQRDVASWTSLVSLSIEIV